MTITPGSPEAWQVLALIQSQYPQFLPYLNKPGVLDAFLSTYGQSDAQVTAAVQNSPYFKQTTQAQRSWDYLSATDPAEAANRYWTGLAHVNQMISKLGITISQQDAATIGTQAISQGWSDAQLQQALIQHNSNPSATQGGDLGATQSLVKQLASNYGLSISNDTAMTWANKIMSGDTDQNAVEQQFRLQAKGLFPGLAQALDAGLTVKDAADPYVQLAAQTLEIDPATVNISDPKWSRLLQTTDSKGQIVAPTLYQAKQLLMSDPTYGYDTTSGARTQAAQLATQLGQKLGAI